MILGLFLVAVLLGLVLASLAALHGLRAELQGEPVRVDRTPNRRR